VAGCQATGVAG